MFQNLIFKFILRVILVFFIVLFLYFFLSPLFINYILHIGFSIDFIIDLFYSLRTYSYSLEYNFFTDYNHLGYHFSYTKFWWNLYFYPKFYYTLGYHHRTEHNLLDSLWIWSINPVNTYAVTESYFICDSNWNRLITPEQFLSYEIPYEPISYYNNRELFVSNLQSPHHMWNHFFKMTYVYGWHPYEEEYYLQLYAATNWYIFGKFLVSSFQYSNFFSAVFLHSLISPHYEILFMNLFILDIEILKHVFMVKIGVYAKYKSLLTILLFWFCSRVLVNIKFLHTYINTYYFNFFLYNLQNYYNKILLFSILLLLPFSPILFIYFVSLAFLFCVFVLYYSVRSNKKFFISTLFVINYFLFQLRKVAVFFRFLLKANKTSRKSMYFNLVFLFYKILFYIFVNVIYGLRHLFHFYFLGNFLYARRLLKPYRRSIRRKIYFNSWSIHKINTLVNPFKYHDSLIPTLLKGSRGGLWVRATQKIYARKLMYENRNALTFFKHKDNFGYFYWQSTSYNVLHYFNQRDYLSLTSDYFFNHFFTGSRLVFTPSLTKSHIIGGISHYEHVHQFLTPFPFDTYIYKTRLAHVALKISIIFYVIYMFIVPQVVKFIVRSYLDFYYKLFYLSFFLSGWFRYQVEFTSYNVDPQYLPYLRFVEFYKLSSYLPLDSYLHRKFNFFLSDTRRHSIVYYLREIDGWSMRYKMFELSPVTFMLSTGALHRAILAFVPMLSIKLSKWSLLFYMHLPFEYFMFAIISFVSKIWFFNKFFGFLDIYIYKSINITIWQKRRFLLNTTKLRLQHGMYRTRWTRNLKLLKNLKRGKYLHTKENNYTISDLF